MALGGNPISATVSPHPGSSESIGIFAAIVIMLVAFGSVVAMGLPILIALVGVGIGFALVDFASHVFTIPSFGPELMAMIGLGVGIDYALFIVTRYRQGLHEGRDAARGDRGRVQHRRPGRLVCRRHGAHLAAGAVRGGPALHGRPRGRHHRRPC